MKKLLFAVNPKAGKAEMRNHALDVIDLFVKHGWEVTVRTTQKSGELTTLFMEKARDYQLVVCSGGDGTLNEAISGLVQSPIRPPLGYIPAGTVNDFATSMHIPKKIMDAAHVVMDGIPFTCDIGKFSDRYFSYVAAFGAFTDVSYATPQSSKNILGSTAYFLEGIKRLPNLSSYQMRIEHDGGCIEDEYIFGMVSNTLSLFGIKLSKSLHISMCDGLMEVILVKNPQNPQQLSRIVNAVLRGDFKSKYITKLNSRKIVVTGPEIPWTLDGEFGGAHDHVVIENIPSVLQIMTPWTLALEE